jgi:hypothetical protein
MTQYDYDYDERPDAGKTMRGYQIVIIALAVILAVMSFIFFKQMRNQRAEFDVERTMLNEQFATLMGDYDNLQTTNDTLNVQMAEQRMRADSILTQLNKERRLSANKIREYEATLQTMRTVARGYVKTIDSLNRVNTRLVGENREMLEQVTTQRLRADMAEESVSELSTKVRQGSVVRARDINLVPLSANDRELSRAGRAAQLRVDFVLSANELAQPGERPVYVRVVGPDGYLLANNPGATFDFEGEQHAYTALREVDYQNQDLGTAVYYKGSGIMSGKYLVEVYMDGRLLGSREVNLR